MMKRQQMRLLYTERSFEVDARGLPNMNANLIDHSEAMVQDGTATLEELNHMTGNLREVGWADLQNICEKHCPAGRNVHGKKGPFL
jgi:hypothetical protein